jgi:hypothetical protein
MIFLIQYNRRFGRIVALSPFDDKDRTRAEDRRLELELELNRKGERDEVVLLEAANEDAMRRTHRRYFESANEIAAPSLEGVDEP